MDGHRVKAPLEYSRAPDKTQVNGARRVRDGEVLIFTARSRNTAAHLDLLYCLDRAGSRALLSAINWVTVRRIMSCRGS